MRHTLWILVLLFALIGAASAIPALPAEFSGTVTIDENPAPAGTTITARIGDRDCGSLTLKTAGTFGGDSTFDKRLLVNGEDTDLGKAIAFFVDGISAGTATYTPGTSTDLALAVTKGDTPDSGSSGSTPPGSSGSGSSSGGSLTPPAAPATEYTGSGTLDTDARGAVQHAVVIAAAGGDARLTIAEGVLAQDRFGRPLDTVSVETAPPGDATRAVRCGPDGATFDPAIEVSFALTPEEWEQAGQFVVRWYNSTADVWEPLATTIHASIRTVTATISHFTLVAVFAVPADTPEDTVTATPAGSETPTSTPAAPATTVQQAGQSPPGLAGLAALAGAALLIRKRG